MVNAIFGRLSAGLQPEWSMSAVKSILKCYTAAGSPLVATEAIATLRAVVRSFPEILAESWGSLLDLAARLVTAMPVESSNHSGIGRKPLQSGAHLNASGHCMCAGFHGCFCFQLYGLGLAWHDALAGACIASSMFVAQCQSLWHCCPLICDLSLWAVLGHSSRCNVASFNTACQLFCAACLV